MMRTQGIYPVCYAINPILACERLAAKQGIEVEFSVKQLHIESGGAYGGGSQIHAITVAEEIGLIEDKFNHFDPYEEMPKDWAERWKVLAESAKHAPRWTVEGVVITPKAKPADIPKMEAALKEYGTLIVAINADEKWYKGVLPTKKWKRLHSVIITDSEPGFWVGYNTSPGLSENNPVVKMHKEYPFASVCAVKNLTKLEKNICL